MSYPMDRFEYDNIFVSEELDFLREENERLKQENEKLRASIKASIQELHDGVADQVRRDTIEDIRKSIMECNLMYDVKIAIDVLLDRLKEKNNELRS